MKVIIIGSVPPPYHGVNVFIDNLLRSPVFARYDVCFLNTSDGREDLDSIGRVDLLNIATALRNMYQLAILCIRQNPALVYICPSQGIAYVREGLFVIVTKFFSRAKIIEHLHGADFLNFYNRSGSILKRFIDVTQRRIDKVIVLGKSLRPIFAKWKSEKDIFVVPNGIDLKLPSASDQQAKSLHFYFLGNLLKFKGIFDILSAIRIVKNQYPDVRVQFAGGWAYDHLFKLSPQEIEREFLAFIRENRLEDNVELLGPVSGKKKLDLLQNSSVLLYPTTNDGFPTVILEAMASRHAVVSTRGVGAIDEMIEDGVTGYLIGKADPEALALQMIRFIENPGLRVQMGEAARKRYEENYTLEITMTRLMLAFETTLDQISVDPCAV